MTILRHLLAWVCWWTALFWLFLLLAGDWNRIELAGAACIAAVGATVAETLRSATGVRPGVPLRLLGSALTVPALVVVDFGIVLWALAASLARRRVVRGRFRARPTDPGTATERAWTVLLATYSPNAYVVDIDPEHGQVLVHDLVPWRKSEEPA